jgi:hypothetical protein
MGALKGQFQCLRGLRVNINSNSNHVKACRWITIAIILHNLVIDVEGGNSVGQFRDIHQRAEEEADRGPHEESDGGGSEEAGEEKRKRLTAQLLAFKGM